MFPASLACQWLEPPDSCHCESKQCSPPGLSLGEEMHVTHPHWCPDPSGGPRRKMLLPCSLLQQSDTLCKDSQAFRRPFLQDKESHFPSKIADYGLPVLRIFFLLLGKGKVTFIKFVFYSFLCRFGFYKYMKMDRPEKSLDSGENTEQPGDVRAQRILLSVTVVCGLAAPAERSCWLSIPRKSQPFPARLLCLGGDFCCHFYSP